jgi:hypothetical protein
MCGGKGNKNASGGEFFSWDACGAFFLPAALFYFSVASGEISFLDG